MCVVDALAPRGLSSRYSVRPARSTGDSAMNCPRCQHENRSGAKFCEECAAPLARACANCGAQLSATAKFCSQYARRAVPAALPGPRTLV
jgi:predicted amidophosphoribosyltransferase